MSSQKSWGGGVGGGFGGGWWVEGVGVGGSDSAAAGALWHRVA